MPDTYFATTAQHITVNATYSRNIMLTVCTYHTTCIIIHKITMHSKSTHICVCAVHSVTRSRYYRMKYDVDFCFLVLH